MKYFLIIIGLAIILCSCNKDKTEDIPSCLKADLELENPSEELLSIATQEIEDILYYKVMYDLSTDGCNKIVTNDCEFVCSIGAFCENCTLDYDNEEWDVIWINL